MKKSKLNIGVKELTFLAALSEGQTLLGVEDPFDGWLAHQVEEEWEKLAPEMEAKQLIKKTTNGEIIVDESIADIIKTCCFPGGCILLSRWEKGGRATNSCYYITRNMQVEKVDFDPPYNCSLTVLQETPEIVKRLEKSFPSCGASEGKFSGGELPSSLIADIRGYKRDELEKGIALLQEKYPSFDEPALLVSALIDSISYTIMIYSDFRKKPVSTYGFSVLESHDSTWKIRAFNNGEEEWLEIKPFNKNALDQELIKFSKKVEELK